MDSHGEVPSQPMAIPAITLITTARAARRTCGLATPKRRRASSSDTEIPEVASSLSGTNPQLVRAKRASTSTRGRQAESRTLKGVETPPLGISRISLELSRSEAYLHQYFAAYRCCSDGNYGVRTDRGILPSLFQSVQSRINGTVTLPPAFWSSGANAHRAQFTLWFDS